MRRWLKRISIGIGVVAALLLLLAIVVQIVLWTSIPRNVAVGLVEKQLGLKISTSKLSIGWFGSTELDDVQLGLPMETKSFLTVKSLKVKNTSLIGLALGRAVSIDSIEVDNPDVYVLQNAAGQWNLQQVATLLGKALGSNTASQSTADKGVPKLPKILLTNGKIHIVDNQNRSTDLAPLNVTGDPDGALVWKYDAKMADSIHVAGQVAPGGNWQHTVSITAKNLEPLVSGFKLPTYNAVLDATWTGAATNGGVAGTLVINKATASDLPQVGNVSATGSIGVGVAGGVVTVSPSKLKVETSLTAMPTVTVDSGSVVSDPTGIHLKQVRVAALDGQSEVTADFNPGTMAADLRADWAGMSLQNQVSRAGYLTLSLREPFPNQPLIKLAVKTNGTIGTAAAETGLATATWATDLQVTGVGTSWGDIDWAFSAPTLQYDTGGKTYSLANLSAHVSERIPAGKTQPMIVLTDLNVPATDLSGAISNINLASSGQVDLNGNKPWKINLSGGFRATMNGTDIPVTLDLKAAGDQDYYQLKNFDVGVADTLVKMDGRYNGRKKDPHPTVDATPVSLHVKLTEAPRLSADSPVHGSLTGDFNIVGDLFRADPKMVGRQTWYPYLTVDGRLDSNDLVVLKHPIGDIAIKLSGKVASPTRPDGSYSPAETHIKATEFFLLNAPWQFAVDYVDPESGIKVALETKNLAIPELTAVADASGVEGRVSSAKWTAVLHGFGLDDVDFKSEYHLTGVAAAGLVVDTVDATVAVQNGQLTVGPILARSGTGTATMQAAMDLHKAKRLTATASVKNWPDKISEACEARVSVDVPLFELDLEHRHADGTLAAAADLYLHNGVGTVTLAHADLAADVHNRLINLSSVSGHVLNGTFGGSARIDLDKPLEAAGRFTCEDIDAEKLSVINPKLMDGLTGNYSGTIVVATALGTEPRPIGPVRVDINVSTADARYRTVNIGGKGLLAFHAVAYADVDRLVLDHSTLFVAGGTMHLWGRVGKGLISKTLLVDFQNLDLDQIAHAAPNVKGPMPGVLNGRIGLVSSGGDITKLTGEGHVDLTQTDLANLGPITALYNLLNVGGGNVQANGVGSVDMSVEQGSVRITGFKLYNRGVDANGLAIVGPVNFDDVMKTRVFGQVRGSVRLLKGSQIGVLSDLDQMASAVQTGATSVDVTGTLEKPVIGSSGLNAIGKELGNIFGGGDGK